MKITVIVSTLNDGNNLILSSFNSSSTTMTTYSLDILSECSGWSPIPTSTLFDQEKSFQEKSLDVDESIGCNNPIAGCSSFSSRVMILPAIFYMLRILFVLFIFEIFTFKILFNRIVTNSTKMKYFRTRETEN